jgi:hypothetical protein
VRIAFRWSLCPKKALSSTVEIESGRTSWSALATRLRNSAKDRTSPRSPGGIGSRTRLITQSVMKLGVHEGYAKLDRMLADGAI